MPIVAARASSEHTIVIHNRVTPNYEYWKFYWKFWAVTWTPRSFWLGRGGSGKQSWLEVFYCKCHMGFQFCRLLCNCDKTYGWRESNIITYKIEQCGVLLPIQQNVAMLHEHICITLSNGLITSKKLSHQSVFHLWNWLHHASSTQLIRYYSKYFCVLNKSIIILKNDDITT